MKPYYQDSAVTIYHGDSLKILSGGGIPMVDLVLTDPPYGLEGGRGNGENTRKRGKMKYSFASGKTHPNI